MKGQLIELIPQPQQAKIAELIAREDGITKLDTIRYDPKNFSYTSISAEVGKALALDELYTFAKNFLPSLLLSKNSIRY